MPIAAWPCCHFLFNDTPHPHTSPLPLHDALPISCQLLGSPQSDRVQIAQFVTMKQQSARISPIASETVGDRKSTRLNSSHLVISYAVFCVNKTTSAHPHRPSSCPSSCRAASPHPG